MCTKHAKRMERPMTKPNLPPMPEDPYAVLCRDLNGKLLGRLTPDGGAVNRKLFAAMFTKEQAEEIAKEINDAGEFTAKAIKF